MTQTAARSTTPALPASTKPVTQTDPRCSQPPARTNFAGNGHHRRHWTSLGVTGRPLRALSAGCSRRPGQAPLPHQFRSSARARLTARSARQTSGGCGIATSARVDDHIVDVRSGGAKKSCQAMPVDITGTRRSCCAGTRTRCQEQPCRSMGCEPLFFFHLRNACLIGGLRSLRLLGLL